MTQLDLLLQRLCRTPRLLVASDFDGVLAPIVEDPADARPSARVLTMLAAFAALRQTDVALISGRSLDDLTSRVGDLPVRGVHVVGGHGAEWPDELENEHLRAAEHRLQPAVHQAEALVRATPGARLEIKPGSVALHYRRIAPEAQASFVEQARAITASMTGVRTLEGRKVVEFCLEGVDKGDALHRIRTMTSASAVVFFGDDVTDEDAFRELGNNDLGVSVGGRRDGARYDLADCDAVADCLEEMLRLRGEWVRETEPLAIEDHAILSDQRTAAVIDPRGTVAWLCLPQIDSPPIFASLLGSRAQPGQNLGTTAGEFSIQPADLLPGAMPVMEPVGDSLILRTRWGDDGRGLVVTDYLDCSGGRPFQRAGRSDLVRVIEGRGRARVRFAPRPDFGRMAVTLELAQDGVAVRGLPDPLVLRAPGVAWTLEHDGVHQTAVAEIDLAAGASPVVLELRYGTGSLREALLPEIDRRRQSERFWSSWISSLTLPPFAVEPVKRSALALKSIIYGPTGAICAAATTSLPECLGGSRNWDYRFCWPRDASFAAAALLRLGNTGPAMRLLDWLLGILDMIGSPERLRPIYTVRGQDLVAEGDISEMSGYAESRPVRIGNAASQQVQLDVFGAIADLAWMLAVRGAPLSADHLRLVEAMATAVSRRWREPDSGIWEIRGIQRHYVHSKVMCWVAMDRAIRVVDALAGEARPEWVLLRDEMSAEILAHGWNESLGAFGLAYELTELDAGSLITGLWGLVSPSDPRFVRTVDAVSTHLHRGKGVLRYRFDDGIPGLEGGFLLCLGWLIEAKLLIGRRDEAESHFNDLVNCAGSTGFLPEQVDTISGRGLGNLPQAYSHGALINAACALADARGAGG